MGLIENGVIISESLLERRRHFGTPLPQFSFGMGDWEDDFDDNEIGDLLLQSTVWYDDANYITQNVLKIVQHLWFIYNHFTLSKEMYGTQRYLLATTHSKLQ